MSELIIASTTDTEEQVQAAMRGEPPPPEPAAASAPAADESQAESAPAADDPDAEPEDSAEDDSASPNKPRRTNGFQKRVQSLTKRVTDRDREIGRLRAELDHERRQRSERTPPAEPPAPVADPLTRPDYAQFPTQEAYLEAVATWSLAKARRDWEAEQRQQQLQQEQQAHAQAWAQRQAQVRAKYADYDEVMESAEIPISPALQEGLLSSEAGPELAYHLATHPDEAQRLAQLAPLHVARALGKLEAQLQSPPTTPPAEPAPPPTPKPPPLTPVTAANGPAQSTVPPDQMEYRDYRDWYDRTFGRKRA